MLARRPWIFFTPFALVHVAVFLAAIAWLAGAVTRVDPAPGSAPVSAALLVQRLQSLAAAGVPIDVVAGVAPGEWSVDLRLAEAARTHRVLLQTSMIDPARLHATRLSLRGGHAEPAPGAMSRAVADADDVVTLLCALVTRSGYVWQPLLVGRGR